MNPGSHTTPAGPPAPGARIDGPPRAIDHWYEAGREAAGMDLVSFALSLRAAGVPPDEVLTALVDYGCGLIYLTGPEPARVAR